MLFSPLKPMIVSIGKEAFNDEHYIFEPKWDGMRLLLHKQGDRIEVFTRYGMNISNKFPELKDAAAAIKVHTGIFDCEGIVLRGGRPVFDDFSYRSRLSHTVRIERAVNTHPATFVVFDVLYTDQDHRQEPLMQRKERLSEIVETTPVLMPTMLVEGQGIPLLDVMKERGMEGIVAKQKESKYMLDTTSKDWLKIKYFKSIDVIILGYRTNPFALVIGLNFRTVKNKPVGVLEFGFTLADKELFLELAKRLNTVKDENTQWIEPRLCCRIDYLERTDTHQLRTTVFRSFLLDMKPEECKWES